MDEVVSDKDEDNCEEEDDDPFCPTIKVTTEEKKRLRRPWRQNPSRKTHRGLETQSELRTGRHGQHILFV